MKTAFQAAYQEWRQLQNGEISDVEFQLSMMCRCVNGRTWDWKNEDYRKLYEYFFGRL